MKKYITLLFVAETILASSPSYFGNSMDECNRFINQFKNTCDPSTGKPANVASVPGEIITCRNTG